MTTHSEITRTPIQRPQSDLLGAEITELCAHIYAATYRLLAKIAEFDANRCWEPQGFCSCAHWLNFSCGVGMNAAREKVRVAHALAGLPTISAAFRAGEISYSKVRAMTRIADADNEDYLMMIARHGTAYHVERLVSQYRRCKRLQEIQAANRQHATRELSYYFDDDGGLVLKGRFSADQGAIFIKALEKALENVSAETSITVDDCEVPPTLAARRADALAQISELFLSSDTGSRSTADRHQVVVHVSAETLSTDRIDNVSVESSARGHSDIAHIEDGSHVSAETHIPVNADVSHIEGGPHVSAETSRRIACDCSVVRVVEDPSGEPLSIGRKSRSIPPAIRRALQFRDNGCRFPGCTHKHFVDGHHIRHWADGGETSLDNLVQLCRFHHRLVHEGGFDCRLGSNGELTFIDRGGATLLSAPLSETVQEREFAVWMRQQSDVMGIDHETCVPTIYAGERIDWDLAVGHLFH